MFDSDKNFLTTFPQYKLLLTMKRTFTEKKKVIGIRESVSALL